MFLERFPMTKNIRDDHNDTEIDPELDDSFTLTIVKRGMSDSGERFLHKCELDIGKQSFDEIIGANFDGKKLLARWQRWVLATDAEKAKNPNAKGHWEKIRK